MGILDAPSLQPVRLAQRLVAVNSKGRFPGAGSASNGTNTGTNVRLRQNSPVAVNGLIARFGNLRNTASNEDAGANNMTLRAAVEFNSISAGVGGLVFWPIFFNGRRDITLEPGAIVDSDLCGIVLPASSNWWLRIYMTIPSGTWWRGVLGLNGQDSVQEGTTETDMTTSGTITVLAGDTFVYGPLGLFTPRRSRTPTVGLVGDSIINGSGDTPVVENGFAVRAFAGTKPFVATSIAGSQVAQFTHYNGKYRLAMLRDCTSVLMKYGTNDLSAAHTLATLQADSLNAWTILANMGMPVYACTLTPRTTSTDSWATLGNQTAASSETVRTGFNDWMRAGSPIDSGTKAAVAIGTGGALLAGSAGHPLKGYFETADAAESARNSGKWKVTGAANYATADGLHPSAAVHTLMAATIDTTRLT